ncbi:MAG: helix-turn-helix domain-containing protein [Patescibacteria group bacterium]
MKPNLEQIKLIDDGATFTPVEAARLLGCTASCVTTWINKKDIKALKVGGRYFISGKDIKEKIEGNTKEVVDGDAL